MKQKGRKKGRALATQDPIECKLLGAYSTVWMVVVCPAPPVYLERGKMVDPCFYPTAFQKKIKISPNILQTFRLFTAAETEFYFEHK